MRTDNAGKRDALFSASILSGGVLFLIDRDPRRALISPLFYTRSPVLNFFLRRLCCNKPASDVNQNLGSIYAVPVSWLVQNLTPLDAGMLMLPASLIALCALP